MMTYECTSCGYTENIWNSRDGVTPFVIKCPGCHENKMRHYEFGKDVFQDSPSLSEGDLVFADISEEEFRDRKKKQVRHMWDIDLYGCRKQFKSEEEMVDMMAKGWTPGTPCVKVVWIDGSFKIIEEE